MLNFFTKREDGSYWAKSCANSLVMTIVTAKKEDDEWQFNEDIYNVAHYKNFFKVALLDFKEFKLKVAEQEEEVKIKISDKESK